MSQVRSYHIVARLLKVMCGIRLVRSYSGWAAFFKAGQSCTLCMVTRSLKAKLYRVLWPRNLVNSTHYTCSSSFVASLAHKVIPRDRLYPTIKLVPRSCTWFIQTEITDLIISNYQIKLTMYYWFCKKGIFGICTFILNKFKRMKIFIYQKLV